MTGHELLNQMLNPNTPGDSPPKRSPAVMRVTPGTINHLKNQTVREALEEKIENLEEELLVQKSAAEEVATELIEVTARASKAEDRIAECAKELEDVKKSSSEEKAALRSEIETLKTELKEAQKKANEIDPSVVQELESLKKEIAAANERERSLESRLAEAEQTSLSSSVLLDRPEAFSISEKFPGEVRAHLLAALAEAMRTADQSGKERRAKILESILYANPPGEELVELRDQVRDIMKNAGSTIGENAIAELEKMGFRFISGSNHNKLDWGGVRIIIPKTPSDKRAFLNSALDIANRVF